MNQHLICLHSKGGADAQNDDEERCSISLTMVAFLRSTLVSADVRSIYPILSSWTTEEDLRDLASSKDIINRNKLGEGMGRGEGRTSYPWSSTGTG